MGREKSTAEMNKNTWTLYNSYQQMLLFTSMQGTMVWVKTHSIPNHLPSTLAISSRCICCSRAVRCGQNVNSLDFFTFLTVFYATRSGVYSWMPREARFPPQKWKKKNIHYFILSLCVSFIVRGWMHLTGESIRKRKTAPLCLCMCRPSIWWCWVQKSMTLMPPTSIWPPLIKKSIK